MIQIAQYRGRSKISRAIRILTYSQYSHSALRFTTAVRVLRGDREYFIRSGTVIEAWTGGVRLVDSLDAQHQPGTTVDLFELRNPLDEDRLQRLAAFLVSQIGKPYDYINVVRFLPFVHGWIATPPPEAWNRSHVFCSELVMRAFAEVKVWLLERVPAWKVSPGLIAYSPLLKQTDTVITR
jgi:uncharacterized protein YycO